MRLEFIPVQQSAGAILVHNVMDAEGHKVLSKGRVVRPEDVEKLAALGRATVYVAIPEPEDVREDDAARRLGELVAGDEADASPPSGGRVNLYARTRGLLYVNGESLERINALDGITLATIRRLAPVAPKKMIATLKTVGLAIPETTLDAAEHIVEQHGAILSVRPPERSKVGILLTASDTPGGRARVQEVFGPAIRARIEGLGAEVASETSTPEDIDAIADALKKMIEAGAQMVIIAGETSIMDSGDITPQGIKKAGGEIEAYGAPVEPGNLLLVAYCGRVPVIGAPGCIKSRETNVVDLILPRLVAGERVSRRELHSLAEGGLLTG